MKRIALILSIVVVATGCGGGDDTEPQAADTTAAAETTTAETAVADPTTTAAIDPACAPVAIADGAYSGALFDAGAQIGDGERVTADAMACIMDRNNVAGTLGFVSVEPETGEEDCDDLFEDCPGEEDESDADEDDEEGEGDDDCGGPCALLGIEFAKQLDAKLGDRFVPFMGTGIPADENSPGDTLTNGIRDALALARENGADFVGFGEFDIYGWNDGAGVSPSDPGFIALVQMAHDEGIQGVLIHPHTGQVADAAALLTQFPDMIFLAHSFANEFDRDRDAWHELLASHPNLFFTVTADHTMFDSESNPPIGLLYRYEQDDDQAEAATRFLEDLGRDGDRILESALARYQPTIEMFPNQVLWGSEAGTDYAYAPAAYDAWIAFARRFIARLDPAVQEPFAVGNAQELFR
jgi:hypothetical protein